jgi:hypothetical protein
VPEGIEFAHPIIQRANYTALPDHYLATDLKIVTVEQQSGYTLYKEYADMVSFYSAYFILDGSAFSK